MFLDALASLLSTGKFHSLTLSENIISSSVDWNRNGWKWLEMVGNWMEYGGKVLSMRGLDDQ